MAISVNFARTFIKEYSSGNIIVQGSLEKATVELIVTLISNKIFPHNGKYANILIQHLKMQPKIVIAKLRKYGIEKDILIELTRLLLTTGSQEIIKEINKIYE